MNAAARVRGLRGTLHRNEPMAAHTSWRVGGPADRYYEPLDREDLAEFVQSLPHDEPILWLGLGSNLLVRDAGFRGTVIALHGVLDRIDLLPDHTVHAEAGAHCARLAKTCVGWKLAGAGFFAGIPGTVGGALAMNAGAHGGETWSRVHEVEVMFRNGGIQWLPASSFRFGYRHVETPPGVLGFLGGRFRFEPDTDDRAETEMKEWLARRKATQPVGKPSAGSTFRNPPGDHAARLIEAAGLKGFRIGDARVSEMHSNFILTGAGATAADVEALIAHIQKVVAEKSGVRLEPEVRIVGEGARG